MNKVAPLVFGQHICHGVLAALCGHTVNGDDEDRLVVLEQLLELVEVAGLVR